MTKPALPRILGSGPLADTMRAQVAADPDRFRPETWSIEPDGVCPCCGEEVFRCTTRHTGWAEGFATHANVVHPRMNPETGEFAKPDEHAVSGCCCKAPNWGPKHDEPASTDFECRRCERLTPASRGADDMFPHLCDDCWAEVSMEPEAVAYRSSRR